MKKPVGVSSGSRPTPKLAGAKHAPTAGALDGGAHADGIASLEDAENAEFLRDKHELSGLELERTFRTLTPEKRARVATLRAKQNSFWVQRREQSLRAPSFLHVLRGSSSPGSAGEPTTAPPRVQRDVVSDDDPEKILLDRFNRDMESAQTLAGHVYTQIFRATGEAPPYDELHQLILDIVGGNNAVATAIRDPSQHKTLTEVGYDLHQLVKANTGKRLLPYTVIRKAPYEFKESKVNSKGMFKIDVYTKDEKESSGYAVIEGQKIAKSKPPKQDEPYTKADVLAREGVVAHLHRLFNETLTRDGPADIYRGFGVELLKRAEDLAKRMGARLMYLEAATSDVRTSPSTNDKESVDPTPFYTKFGYGVDAESAAHNWAFAMAQAEQAQLEMSQSIKLAQRQVKGLIEGMLSKMLT